MDMILQMKTLTPNGVFTKHPWDFAISAEYGRVFVVSNRTTSLHFTTAFYPMEQT